MGISAENDFDGAAEGQTVPPVDRLIAEIGERARTLSLEHNNVDGILFSNWLQVEEEIRKKYGLLKRDDPEEPKP